MPAIRIISRLERARRAIAALAQKYLDVVLGALWMRKLINIEV